VFEDHVRTLNSEVVHQLLHGQIWFGTYLVHDHVAHIARHRVGDLDSRLRAVTGTGNVERADIDAEAEVARASVDVRRAEDVGEICNRGRVALECQHGSDVGRVVRRHELDDRRAKCELCARASRGAVCNDVPAVQGRATRMEDAKTHRRRTSWRSHRRGHEERDR